MTNENVTAAISHINADIDDYFAQLDRLYDLGARRFLTILVPRE